MCVTNTTIRRSVLQPISFLQPADRLINAQRPFEFSADVVVGPLQSCSAPEQPCSEEKQRTKRRRKPQKPGMTAKNQERHFVVHNYHDHAVDSPQDMESDGSGSEDHHHRRRGGVAVSFPLKLHSVLDQITLDGYDHVISWMPHGRAFAIHQPKLFTEEVMPKYFRQSKLTSFQRQLNLYGFQRLTRGADTGAYYSELFLRGKPFLCKKMIRTKVKGTRYKAASSPEQEPDFYTMPPVSLNYAPKRCGEVTPPHSPTNMLSHHQHQCQLEDALMLSAPILPLSADPLLLQVSSSSFDVDDEESSDYYEPIPWVPGDDSINNTTSLCDADMQSVLLDDEPMDELSLAGGFCAAWDPLVDHEIQAALESDDKLEEMIERLLEE